MKTMVLLVSLLSATGCSLAQRAFTGFVSNAAAAVILRDSTVSMTAQEVENSPGSVRIKILQDGQEMTVICPVISGRKLVARKCAGLPKGAIIKYLDGRPGEDPDSGAPVFLVDELKAL